MTSEVKNLTNKLAAQFFPHGDKDTGVPSKSIKTVGLFCFHRHSGTPQSCRDVPFFKNEIVQST